MKKIFTFLFVSILFVSCSSDDSDSGPSLVAVPDAKSMYDGSNYGIYKGVFVGSSGTVFIDVNNNGATTAQLIIDGTTHNFSTTESVTEGNPISGLTFTSGSMSFDFNVDSDGTFPYVNNINFSNHPNAAIEILKEYSDMLVECYKGTYSGDDAGVFNLIVAGDEVFGLALSNDGDESIYLDGSKNGNTVTGFFDGGSFNGTKNNNSINGTWQNLSNESGNFNGQRRL